MSLVHETDYGTPASKSSEMVTLTIDGQAVTVPAGTSIMRAAMDAGIQVPKLCATDSVDAFGSCRLCLVEITGRPGTPASCTTPVAPGMVVSTQTERLKQIRKGVMELYISDHPLDCLTCGACVQACPTATLSEKTLIDIGQPEHSVVTTCAYCGVGCSFKAEMRGEELVRMVPYKDGKANRGHSCVKGRFAWGYANHRERILKPMIRETIDQPWREVTWDVAIERVASEFKRLQAKHGRLAIGGITSSRCTNEETYLVQKLVRGGFGNNNVDTCARVCHSPTGYGLRTAFGTSAGTQDFDSVEHTDVVLIIGANPTDAHPVFASRMKKRLRQGAKLIVIDPRRIDMVRTPHIEAAHHLALRPGTNVAVMTSLAHVIVTEGLANEAFIRERCDWDEYQDWAAFVSDERHSPEFLEPVTGVPAADLRAAARLYATGGNSAI